MGLLPKIRIPLQSKYVDNIIVVEERGMNLVRTWRGFGRRDGLDQILIRLKSGHDVVEMTRQGRGKDVVHVYLWELV